MLRFTASRSVPFVAYAGGNRTRSSTNRRGNGKRTFGSRRPPHSTSWVLHSFFSRFRSRQPPSALKLGEATTSWSPSGWRHGHGWRRRGHRRRGRRGLKSVSGRQLVVQFIPLRHSSACPSSPTSTPHSRPSVHSRVFTRSNSLLSLHGLHSRSRRVLHT